MDVTERACLEKTLNPETVLYEKARPFMFDTVCMHSLFLLHQRGVGMQKEPWNAYHSS